MQEVASQYGMLRSDIWLGGDIVCGASDAGSDPRARRGMRMHAKLEEAAGIACFSRLRESCVARDARIFFRKFAGSAALDAAAFAEG